MSASIIEICDNNMRLGVDGTCVISQPGYAYLSGDEVVWGNQAKAMARLHPLQTYNQYWHNLSLDPLRTPSSKHRHYADLAYLQLESLYQQSKLKTSVIFATPANFTRSQLSLLLGIAEQCSFEVAGIVDSPVASVASLALRGTVLYADIQLHQTVISVVSVEETADRVETEIVHDVGILSIQNQWAQYVTDTFIAQTRFDPLNHASSEQSLYNQLPNWVERSQEETEFFAEIDGKQVKLNSIALQNKGQALYQNLRQYIQKLKSGGGTIYLSSSAEQLPGLGQFLSAEVLPDTHILQTCHQLQGEIISDGGEGIAFVTSLPVSGVQERRSAARESNNFTCSDAATHILDGSVAYPILETTTVGFDGQTFHMGNATSPFCSFSRIDKHISIAPINGLASKVNGAVIHDPTVLHPGDTVQLGESYKRLTAIKVCSGL